MSSLPARLISAAVAIAILFGARHFYEADGLFIVTFLVILIGFTEFTKFFKGGNAKDLYFKLLFVVAGALTYLSSYISLTYLLFSFWATTIMLIAYLLLRLKEEDAREDTFHNQCLSAIGLLYVGMGSALTAQLLYFPHGPDWFLTCLGVVFLGDSFAFFSGYLLGKRKLHAIVSPKKTWAGAMGGILGSLFAGYLFTRGFGLNIGLGLILVISFCTGIAGQFGDLFESLMKRAVGVKDSGSIMPGHGGILDRIDGVLFSGPVFFVLLKLFHYS